MDRHEDKLEKLQEDTNTIDKLTYILEETRKTSERTTETLSDITNTLSKMSVSIDATNQKVQELSDGQDEMRKDMKATNEKVEDISDKGKFDIWSFIKTKAVPILISSGLIYWIATLQK